MPVSFCDSSMCVSCEQTKKGISKTRLKVNLYFARKNKYTITKTTRDKRQILQNDRHQEIKEGMYRHLACASSRLWSVIVIICWRISPISCFRWSEGSSPCCTGIPYGLIAFAFAICPCIIRCWSSIFHCLVLYRPR